MPIPYAHSDLHGRPSWHIPKSPAQLPLVPELLHIICEFLHNDKRSLGRLAQTCKAFKDPALDVLWSSIEDVIPLVKVVSPRKFMVRRVHKWEDEMRRSIKFLIEPGLSEKECERIMGYAKRVRKYEIKSTIFNECSRTILQSIHKYIPNAVLFPNLRSLKWRGADDNMLSTLTFFDTLIGPYTNEFNFKCTGETAQRGAKEMVLKLSSYSRVKHLTFDWVEFSKDFETDMVKKISNAVLQWDDLETLEVVNLTENALLALSSSSTLKKMKIINFRSDFVEEWSGVGMGSFSVLSDLTIGVSGKLQYFLPMLRFIDLPPALQTLTLQFKDVDDTSATVWKDIFTAIHSHCRPDILTTLNIRDLTNHENIQQELDDIEEFCFDSMSPLLNFKDILRIHIDVPRGFGSDFNSEAAIAMASAWRKIQVLKFTLPRYCRCGRLQNMMTLTDLTPFARTCPDLEELGLFIDAEMPPKSSLHKPGNGIFQTALKKLVVGDFVVDDPLFNIATFLSSVFPALNTIDAFPDNLRDQDDYPDAQYERFLEKEWCDISCSLYLCRKIREQEMYQHTSKTYLDVYGVKTILQD